ncbi:ABC transporter permease subunit [Burkholderia multivorans]|uniref:ABC transporter permease n=1 Tax=Burkholderia multivorans TaxID=87883 RepID=UPI000CFF79E4|nr:ABC transporter permease subunit [Burkholderia multivorans]MDN7861998.1 ABC transporter permease subunit [Burkholderia multivorans]PRE97301.1 sulfonate ABC transporter permease [Burkholderia multivorans]
MSTIESASTARTAPASAGGAGAAVSRVACSACDAASAADARRTRVWPAGIAAALAWTLLAAVTQLWPNRVVGFTDWAYTDTFATAAGAFAVLLFVAATLGPLVPAVRAPLARVRGAGPWLVALPLLLAAWEIATAKTGWLPTPFFAPPQALIEVYVDDWPRLAGSAVNTLKLLALGFAYGVAVGFAVGVSIGWSRRIGYWMHPVLRVLGPVPATALLPLTFYFFPTSYSAAAFLIALATGFPVAVLTWSGVASVNRQYYDVARTFGASARFLVLRVAIPAALPHVFVGIFMGLSASFTVLVVAEMMGVKSGLGWYLSWAQGWASYVNMYAALIVMALLFSGLIALLFALRDRVLAWQKGTVQW